MSETTTKPAFECVRAKVRRSDVVIVFVHQFGGSKKSVLRHVKLVNELGFDAVRFDLLFHDNPFRFLPITAELRFGARHIWADQIETVLNAIPEKKIIYSFSMPSASAVEALSRRKSGDVVAMICDGGPFLQIARCSWNLYEYGYKIKSVILRGLFAGASVLLWGIGFEAQAARYLNDLPSGFPILSLRGGADPVVPGDAIEDFFKTQTHLNLQTVVIPDGEHLDGLKNHAKFYIPAVEKFLRAVPGVFS